MKDCSKYSKKQWTLCKFTLKNCINSQLLPISLHFSVFIWIFFPPGSGSSRENECGSMWIRIHSPGFHPHCSDWEYQYGMRKQCDPTFKKKSLNKYFYTERSFCLFWSSFASFYLHSLAEIQRNLRQIIPVHNKQEIQTCNTKTVT